MKISNWVFCKRDSRINLWNKGVQKVAKLLHFIPDCLQSANRLFSFHSRMCCLNCGEMSSQTIH